MSKKTKTNFISASVKRVRSLTLLVTGGVVMSSMALALLLQDTASSNNENVQVWGVQSRVQYLTEMTLSWANNNHIKFKYNKDTNSLNLNAAVNLHALILGASNSGVTGATVIGGHDNEVQGNWKNAAIIGGSNNTTNNTTSSIIAGSKGSSIIKAGESAIFSAQGTMVGGENPTDTVFIVWGQNHITTNASTVFIAGAEGIQTTKSHNVLIGKNIRSDQENIFAWSDTQLAPEKGNAFYVSASNGFGLNTNNPSVALDISNGGLAFNKVYQLSDLADVKESWVILMVAKDGKQGICAYNGTTWVPLSLNAEREWLCVGNTQPAHPIHVLREAVTISGAVANGSAVLTNGVTSLPQVWSNIANGDRWGWENHPWTYKHTGTLNDGEYRCGIGYHMGNPTPDGMKNTNCSSCTPITNQRDWRSNGKNNDCEFSCKAGFKKVGRSCDACEVWTYSVNGTTANSCASCMNKPANSHYTSNGTSATSCTWACDAGYHNVGWACKKAVWQKTDTYTCNVAGGKWKDDKIVTTYHCALAENGSVSVPEHICSHWGAKPATKIVVKWDINCNPPEWETTWNCPNPSCNTSRIAGKCGGVTEAVTCTQHKRDRAWNSYESRTQSQQKACTRACETAACGGANGVATKYQPTALCAAGTASAVGGNASVWSWTCTQLDGAKNCSANRLPLKGGSCWGLHNTIIKTLPSSNTPNLCEYGTVDSIQDIAWFVRIHPLPHLGRWKWKCRGDAWATNEEVNCLAHAPEPKAGECNLSEVNKCTVGTVEETSEPLTNGTRWKCVWIDGGDSTTCSVCDGGYKYNSTTSKCEPKCGAGYTLHAGICVKWACVETSASPKLWWARPVNSEMPRGWMSLFSVSAWSLYEWPQWSRWTYSFQWPRWPQWSRSPAPKWPSETSEGPLEHGRPKGQGPKGPERAPFQPPVHVTQQYQWPSWPRKPQQSPTWLNKTAKCVDDKWNIRPDDFCVNAGPKPECAPLQQCSVGFTLSNGKCVKWECRATTVKPSLPAGCFPRFSRTSRKVSREEAVVQVRGNIYQCKNVGNLRVGPPPHALYETVFEACQKEAGKDIPYFEPNCRNQTARSSCESIRVGEIALCSWADEGQPRPPVGGVWYCPVGRCIPQWPPPPPWGAVGWTVKKAKCVSDSGEELEDALCPSSTRPNCQQVQTPPPPPGPPKLSKINGQCKTYAWSHTSQPATSTANGCLAGDYLDDADTNTYWQWKCKGKDWGSEAICKATKWVDGKCWAAYMTCQAWTPSNWSQKRRRDSYYYNSCVLERKRTCLWIGWEKQECRISLEINTPQSAC